MQVEPGSADRYSQHSYVGTATRTGDVLRQVHVFESCHREQGGSRTPKAEAGRLQRLDLTDGHACPFV